MWRMNSTLSFNSYPHIALKLIDKKSLMARKPKVCATSYVKVQFGLYCIPKTYQHWVGWDGIKSNITEK